MRRKYGLCTFLAISNESVNDVDEKNDKARGRRTGIIQGTGGRNYHKDHYYMDIRLEDGEIIKDVEVKDDAYDGTEYEEAVIMIKMENSICDIDRVYPEKVFCGGRGY